MQARNAAIGMLAALVDCGSALGEVQPFTPSRDAYVNGSMTTTTNNNDSLIVGKATAAAPLYRSFLHFNVSTISNNAIVSSAVLKLNLRSAQGNPTASIELWRVLGTWDENSLTWGNAPATTNLSNPRDVGTTIGESPEWTVTALVQSWISNPSTNHGVALRIASESTATATRTFASSEHGTTAFRPALTVAYTVPPSITAQPQSRTNCPGTTATFSVAATGTAPLSYQWRRGTIVILGATNEMYAVTNVAAANQGNYSVVVSNAAGVVTSSVATLTVVTPVTTSGPGSLTRCPGQSATFITTASGTGPFTYQWRKGSSNIPGATSSAYTINPVSAANAGTYSVVVSDACGNATSTGAVLTVNEAPGITGQPQNLEACPGQSAGFTVTASGTAPLSYQWLLNGVTIPAATGSNYAINPVGAANAGTYTVVVTNSCGSVTTLPATLTLSTPVTSSGPGSLTNCPGTSATFSTTPSGTGPFTYQWWRNGVNIPGANGSAYSLGSVTADDAGNYCVIVSGACNSVTNCATLTVPSTLLLSMTDVWKYEQTANLDGIGWQQPDYDDSPWPSGAALLYVETAPLPAPANTPLTIGRNTYYFRTHFNLPNQPSPGSTLVGYALIDDGAVIWLNGVEAGRVRMDTNIVLFSYSFPADREVTDATNYDVLILKSSSLRQGDNVLAVEVHQRAVLSSDIVFGLALELRDPGPCITQQPASITTNFGSTVTFQVTVDGNPPFRYQWRLNGDHLPGATNSTLTVTNAQLPQGGGYSVIVANAVGVVASQPAVLLFNNLPFRPGGDHFTNRVSLGSFTFNSANTNATKEPGEPNHAGKLGGKSVWYTWKAPATGIATLRTTGSSFDTLLAVYTNDLLAALAPVAGEDDGGGFFTSEVRFNAAQNISYQIAIDGLGGREGPFVLQWGLEVAANAVLPVILSHPPSRAVLAGSNSTFTVSASGSGLTYQWFFNGAPLPGANSNTLLVTNVGRADLGSYTVRVTNSFSRGVESRPAALEIGPVPSAVSHDKVEDLLLATGFGVPGPLHAFQPAADFVAFVSVSVGTIGSHEFPTRDATESGNCLACVVPGGKSKWIGLTNLDGGILTIDTIGSNFDTVLKVYFPGDDDGNLCAGGLVACDNNSASNGSNDVVIIRGQPGTVYWVRVDGFEGQAGDVVLNWKLCLPAAPFLLSGDNSDNSLLLAAATNAVRFAGPYEFEWRTNDQVMARTQIPTFTVRPLPPSGTSYSVIISSRAGRLTNQLGKALRLEPWMDQSTGAYQIQVRGLRGEAIKLEAVDRVWECEFPGQWQAVTNYTVIDEGTGGVRLIFPVGTPNRFYRLRPGPPQ